MRYLIALTLVATLAACASPEPRIVERVRLVRVEVPAELLTCAEAPPRPALACALGDGRPAVCDRDAAAYGLAVEEAGEDCRAKLRAVGEVVSK